MEDSTCKRLAHSARSGEMPGQPLTISEHEVDQESRLVFDVHAWLFVVAA